jgi:RIO kinase 2
MKKIFARFRELDDDDFRLLTAIEVGHRRSSLVPQDELLQYTGFDSPDLKYHLGRLFDVGLIISEGEPYKGYKLVPRGYDFLALNVMVKRGRIDEIGDRVAVGKESEIYEALLSGRELAIKFHRLGRTSFQRIVRLRGYLRERHHFTWLYASRIAAQREYEALRRLHGAVPVPEALSQNRNALLMARFYGSELIRSDVAEPAVLMKDIIDAALHAKDLGVIHGDLSEYNVLVNDSGFIVIDWPQWIGPDHPQATEIFQRDIGNIERFFEKKFGSSIRDSNVTEEN